MLENKHFSAKHKTGDSIKLRTDSGVIHDSCEANIGSLQGNCRSISAILCDGALDGEKWHVINRVHAQTGAFYDHIAVKGAVSEAQALRLCQKYFNPFENAVTKSVVAVGDNGLKLFLDSENTPTNTNFFLPQDAQILDSMVTHKPVEWTDEKLSSHLGTMSHLMLDMATYDLSGELLEKVTPKDVVSMLVDDQCEFMMYDAMILKYRQLDLAMKKIAEALKQSDTEEFFVKEVTPIEPFKRQGVVNVGAIFEMSDTQTITVLFNNPDTTPAKLTSTDVITSWKWILNKRDVTAVLQPRAVDAKKYPMIANRMYQLLAKNHARFKRAQAVRNKDEALLAELIGQLEADQLEARMIEQQIADIQTKIDDIGVKKQQQEDVLSKDATPPQQAAENNAKSLDGLKKTEALNKARELVADYVNYKYSSRKSLDELVKMPVLHVREYFESEEKRLDDMYAQLLKDITYLKFNVGFKKDAKIFDEIASEAHSYNKYSNKAKQDMYLFRHEVGNAISAAEKQANAQQAAPQEETAADAQLQGAIAKVQRIVDELIADYGFSYETDVKSTELDKTLISENGYNLSIVIDEDDSEIILDSSKLIVDRIDTTESEEYIVKAIAQADFEYSLGFDDTDLVEDEDSPYFGKNAEYAFTIKQLDEAVKSLGLDIVYNDFDKTEAISQGLFDSLESSNAKLIYGITAQIGKDGEVLARARVDFDGNLELLSGATGSTVLKSLKFDLAVKKNIVAALGGDAVKTTPKTTPKTTADNPHNLPAGFRLDADVGNDYWVLYRDGVSEFTPIFKNDDGTYRAQFRNSFSPFVKELDAAVQWGVNVLNALHKQQSKKNEADQEVISNWQNMIPAQFDKDKFLKAIDLTKAHSEKKGLGWNDADVFRFVQKKFTDFENAHKDLAAFETQADILNNGVNDLSRVLFGLYTNGDVVLKGLSQKAGKTRMDKYAKEIFTKDQFDQYEKDLKQIHKAALEKKQQEQLRELEFQVSSYMSGLSTANQNAIKKWFNEGFDPIPVKVGVVTRYQFVNEKEGVKYKIQNNSTYRELESTIKAANVVYGSMREALIHLGYLERPAPIETDAEAATDDTPVFEPTVTRYSIKSTNPRARKPVGSVKLTSREDGMSDVLFVMDGVGGEYVGAIEDVKKWVAMRMQGLGSAAAGEASTFSDVAPRLTLVEGEDLLGVNGAPSQPIEQVQTMPPVEESAVNENEKFLNDVIAGAVDLGADATGERLEQIGEDLDPALEDLFEQAAEAYAQFAINNAQNA